MQGALPILFQDESDKLPAQFRRLFAQGCDEKCLETMLAMQPKRIVYVSCDSATLARDLGILTEGGYEVKRVRCLDQFSQSVHVETVVLMSKVGVEYA